MNESKAHHLIGHLQTPPGTGGTQPCLVIPDRIAQTATSSFADSPQERRLPNMLCIFSVLGTISRRLIVRGSRYSTQQLLHLQVRKLRLGEARVRVTAIIATSILSIALSMIPLILTIALHDALPPLQIWELSLPGGKARICILVCVTYSFHALNHV